MRGRCARCILCSPRSIVAVCVVRIRPFLKFQSKFFENEAVTGFVVSVLWRVLANKLFTFVPCQ
jgi:hypothetical protein